MYLNYNLFHFQDNGWQTLIFSLCAGDRDFRQSKLILQL